ncbi:ParB/RepB/Spo0J family partition protein [Candidatus Nitrosotenuis chungbukensis]|uniref:ParB/RepB/Spo0J family partition protein n=1 Tax=Candidatus Nitrosotenuis chungbukensis TaxID=1353246 RepID=UPI002672BD5A|nr:ParB/RepB/Spo0J family partition protein [Candidatus Nitrosotenuis chungbukensis]WKT57302.1 ParB/RepB/Spo0J family partition protein [Candidatus Nitrosotenuis chungbukensis]
MSQRYRQKIHYRVKVIPIKRIHVWDEAQARSLDRDGIRELAKSIKNEGLQNPPMVQKDGRGRFLLMSGQRRLAALKLLRAKKFRFWY